MISNIFGKSWKRKVIVTPGSLGPVFQDIKPKDEFVNMIDILREAERYDSIGEIDLRDSHLKVLTDYIEFFTGQES